MLSRELHRQIFKNTTFPRPLKTYVQIAKEHLKTHGLDPSQGSILPDTHFTLPKLRGSNLDEHFHIIGSKAAEPWLSLANDLASSDLPPKPECFVTQIPGWTKYTFREDGSSYTVSVDYPIHDGVPEQLLVFDVETTVTVLVGVEVAYTVVLTTVEEVLVATLLTVTVEPSVTVLKVTVVTSGAW